MIKLHLTDAERTALQLIEERKYFELEKFLEQHNFSSGLLKAIRNFEFEMVA